MVGAKEGKIRQKGEGMRFLIGQPGKASLEGDSGARLPRKCSNRPCRYLQESHWSRLSLQGTKALFQVARCGRRQQGVAAEGKGEW